MSNLSETPHATLRGRRLLHLFGTATRPLLRHPLTNVILGLGLLATGVIELVEGFVDGFETVIDAHHGIILFGFVTVLRGLLELLEAAEVFAIAEREFEAEDAGPEGSRHGA
ncbi:MAG: hypothetical protein ACOCTP_02255 [Roseicyclus sp.]